MVEPPWPWENCQVNEKQRWIWTQHRRSCFHSTAGRSLCDTRGAGTSEVVWCVSPLALLRGCDSKHSRWNSARQPHYTPACCCHRSGFVVRRGTNFFSQSCWLVWHVFDWLEGSVYLLWAPADRPEASRLTGCKLFAQRQEGLLKGTIISETVSPWFEILAGLSGKWNRETFPVMYLFLVSVKEKEDPSSNSQENTFAFTFFREGRKKTLKN